MVQAVDEVGCHHQIIIPIQRLQIAGVGLEEVDSVRRSGQAQGGEVRRLIALQFTLFGQRVGEVPTLAQLHAYADEACREVEAGDLGAVLCQFKTTAAYGTTDVQSAPQGFARHGLHSDARDLHRKFLEDIADRILPGGLLVITSPYTWLEEHTARTEWLGGFKRDGENLSTFDALREILSGAFRLRDDSPQDLSFVIRETARKYQHSIAQVTIWERL